MPKRKRSPVLIKSLEELISDYDRETLVRALQSFKVNDLGWQILRAALMKEHLIQASYVLEDASKTGKQIEASYHSGCSQTLYDTATTLIDKYVDFLEKNTHVTEDVRPEE